MHSQVSGLHMSLCPGKELGRNVYSRLRFLLAHQVTRPSVSRSRQRAPQDRTLQVTKPGVPLAEKAWLGMVVQCKQKLKYTEWVQNIGVWHLTPH